jgi:transposase InsO family protein
MFGVNWLLKRFNIYPNAYYNYLKGRKTGYQLQKAQICRIISRIYHENNGVLGYRSMRVFLSRKKIYLSPATVHKYMNKELKLFSVARRKKPNYRKGKAHKVFPNLLQQDFSADKINAKWCTDFTYLYLADGRKRYNCTIIDLHDRSVVASLNGMEITSDLAIRTVKKALSAQPAIREHIILHSDQGSQFTSNEFVEFCESVHITQSMSKAGYPYDNAPMERYYNTLKNEMIYLHNFHSDEELNRAVNDFAYFWYNHVRPHSYNNYQTPFQARYQICFSGS